MQEAGDKAGAHAAREYGAISVARKGFLPDTTSVADTAAPGGMLPLYGQIGEISIR